MKIVFSPSVICLASFLLRNCSGSPASLKSLSSESVGSHNDPSPWLSKRDNHGSHPVFVARSLMSVAPGSNDNDKTIEYTMSHNIDLTKSDVEVYTGKNVVYHISQLDKPGHFKIVDSHGKTVLEVKPKDQMDCSTAPSYISVDEKVNFAMRGTPLSWTLSFSAGQVFVLDRLPDAPRTSVYERNLTLRGTVDTTVSTNLSGSETIPSLKSVDTIRVLSTSKCPVQYSIALLVIDHVSKTINNIKKC